MAFQRKLNTLILHKALKEKCKVIGCKKPKRVSGNCKKHEALNFLDYLRKTFKKLFGSLSSGLEALEKECGKEFNVKDLCGFLNFLMICYSHERVVSLFESFGKRSHKNLNFVMDFKIFKQNLEKTKNVDNNQKFASYQESLETLINNTDTRKPDESDLFHEKRLITSYDVSKKSFQSEFYLNRISSKDESIVSDRMDPTIYTKDYENELFGAINHENPEITKGLDLDLFKFTEAPLEKSQNQFISFFKDKLALKYSNFTEAFNSISRNLVSIGYFEILRELKELGILSDDKHVKEVILNIGDYKRGVISAQNFKEFWLEKDGVCVFSSCTKRRMASTEYCFIHQKISNHKAANLLGKIKQRTNSWKSPKQAKVFFEQLETFSHDKSISSLKQQVSQILPKGEVSARDIKSLRTYMNGSKAITENSSRLSLPSARVKTGDNPVFETPRFSNISTPKTFTPKGAGYFCRIRTASARTRETKGSFVVTNKSYLNI